MRIFAISLGLALILLQYQLWFSDQGYREVTRLQGAINAQMAANAEQSQRNARLAAEVQNLKIGFAALEERARSELGMIGDHETFYEIVSRATPAPPPPPGLTARAQ